MKLDPETARIQAEAKAKYKVRWWEPDFDPLEMAYYQLHESVWLVRFGDFHVALEQLLGRSVWAHEIMLCRDVLKHEADRVLTNRPLTEQEKAQASRDGADRLRKHLGRDVEFEENTPEDFEGIAKDRRLS